MQNKSHGHNFGAHLYREYPHKVGLQFFLKCTKIIMQFKEPGRIEDSILSGVVILHIENKSAPLRRQKIINPPQNRAVNFQKFPYF